MIVSFIFHTAVHVASPVVSLTCTFRNNERHSRI